MTRKELENYIDDVYSTGPDYPWFDDNAVFRHSGSRKWFALIMEIPKEKLGLREPGLIDVVNLKCPPLLIPSLTEEPGVFPAYHMSKVHWITVALDGSASDDTIKMALDLSYEATSAPVKQRRR